jgi:hypothetical protein
MIFRTTEADSMEQRVLLKKLTVLSAGQEILPPSMESEGALPRSQEPATDPYPEPDKSNPHLPNQFS